MPVVEVKSPEDFQNYIKSDAFVVIHFYEDWAAQCQTMNEVFDELSKQPENNAIKFLKCRAEELSEISLKYQISAVPTILLFKNQTLAETVHGASAAELNQKLERFRPTIQSGSVKGKEPLEDRLKALINQAEVMVFMKGNPQQPRCGFSRTLIAILNETKLPYKTFDILEDEDVRQGLKTYSDWPTYPQIYVKGELIGGLDIVKELQEQGQLISTLKPK